MQKDELTFFSIFENYKLRGNMAHKGLSKSKYVAFCSCEKLLWLRVYKSELAVVDDASMARMETGNEVGDLAMQLFGDFVEVTAKNDDGSLNLKKMLEDTRKCLDEGCNNICEASFSYHGCYCAVDILRKEKGGYAIYEVKSSTEVKDYHLTDIAYQKYVLEKCGMKVTGTYIVHIDNSYVFDGTLDVAKLFVVEDVAERMENEYLKVPTLLPAALKIVANEEEPVKDIDENCCGCEFWGYCAKHVPNPSVFDLYRVHFSKKIAYYREGLISYEDLQKSKRIENPIHIMQLEGALNDKTFINNDGISDFLKTLSYPLYFLDFETMQQTVPDIVGTRPYQQIPFQYSLHYIENEGGELKHKDFLAESGKNPLRDIAERLCQDIPKNVCTIAYNKTFECSRINELAELFPDLADHLLNIKEHIVDLLVPFQKGNYYVKEMGGSFSIKSVLPALFPDDPSLNYHNLDERVQNGGDAMNIFPKIKDMPPEEQKNAREALLEYCKLDTLAMVKVWEKLKDAVKK